ncbi:DeoR family transcriptional regulator [Candidatus Berkiella cookevillensis]|nr:DeoR family transcriptional regulator [Candidatus Berkiella cookevillensis]MCS5707927.1 DeoR family transcriptional regulator [Candidatus Berkiella cookevillensis]
MDTLAINLQSWENILIKKLKEKNQLGTTDIAELWKVTTRTARTRLRKMMEKGIIIRIGTSAKDPYAVFKLK